MIYFQGASSSPNSPRRFANQGMVYLSEIETLDDLNELSTKQVKELLAMNRLVVEGIRGKSFLFTLNVYSICISYLIHCKVLNT